MPLIYEKKRCKMDSNSNGYKKNVCRICLDDNVWSDWDTALYQFHDTTYKDCYYKYTQLECKATDPFPQMLSENCCNALHSTHTLILTALESHKVLLNKFSSNVQSQEELRSATSNKESIGYSHCTPVEFETILVEKFRIDPFIYAQFKYNGSSDEDDCVASKAKKTTQKKPKAPMAVHENIKIKRKRTRQRSVKTENKLEKHLENLPNVSLEMNASSIKLEKHINEGEQTTECNSNELNLMDGNTTEKEGGTTNVESKAKKKSKHMCSICSKILTSKRAVQFHEQTHIENRERKEICKICGLKFYEQRNLDGHMRIHKEDREKSHKCEFCSKAFYDKGSLNIHRRIHLGQMIPCSLCPKQFYRQVDLDKHMNTHSATTINANIKKRSRYFVRCPHCDKSILSTTFKSHTAAHLNEPLMKCSICNKEFFSRKSCVLHVKKVHQKTNEEYNDFIIKYAKDRISQLFLKQLADVQANND